LKLRTPLAEREVRALHLGDGVVLSGIIYTGRDEMHLRALEFAREGKALPVDLEGAVLYHTGPIMRRSEGGWQVVAGGPTTSARMNSIEPEFIERFRIRAIIGKGGMSLPTVEAMQRSGCVYLAMTGGAALLAAQSIKRVMGVEWLDLGMPEALWILEAEDLGPLTVAIDAHGNSLYQEVEETVTRNLPSVRRQLGL
jgi:fumarate hydratase subunit beta